MAQMKSEMIPFITKEEIEDLVESLAQQIERDYAGRKLVMICPLKGSFLFVADLMRKINLDQELDFVHLTSPKNEGVRILKDISIDITGKDVLILEEIVDAGRTLSFLVKRLLANDPETLKVVSLFDKPARRELPIKPDYIGKTIDDRYVIGYGMDSEEYGRNYEGLFTFSQ
ncbi:MAG: hypoxanthine phosphoribosyltransferase [Bdellovibrionales bacterium]|nr:hypoxanthine phosphoribosyltransferase [Bdellovibrionales bacterium]